MYDKSQSITLLFFREKERKKEGDLFSWLIKHLVLSCEANSASLIDLPPVTFGVADFLITLSRSICPLYAASYERIYLERWEDRGRESEDEDKKVGKRIRNPQRRSARIEALEGFIGSARQAPVSRSNTGRNYEHASSRTSLLKQILSPFFLSFAISPFRFLSPIEGWKRRDRFQTAIAIVDLYFHRRDKCF